MKHLITLFVALMASLIPASAISVDEVPNVHLADSTRFVSNPDGVLSPQAVAELDRTLGSIWRQTTTEPVVVAVNTVDEDIDDFATHLFEAWGIGKKDNDNGLLVVVAKDDRKAVIRTGRGVEGVVPDVVAARILRHVMFPRFREEDYDGGIIATVDTLGRVLTNPAYAGELRSAERSNANPGGRNDDDLTLTELFYFYLSVSFIAAVILIIYAIYLRRSTRRKGPVERYTALEAMNMFMLMASFLTLGMALPAWLILRSGMRHVRKGPRHCPNCNTKMKKLDEEADNAYLTPTQDAEERFRSVDYDVWVCPTCNEVDIFPFVNRQSIYSGCPHCGARTFMMTSDRIQRQPTTSRNGQGVKTYVCRHCGARDAVPYTIPMLVAPIIIGGGGGGFSGGGFGGGSFGGGGTAGGGASGGW